MSSAARTLKVAIIVAGIGWAMMGSPTRADIVIDLGRGPVTVSVPPSYDPGVPTPLVCLLHGYTADGEWVEYYLQFQPLSDEYGFLYLHPNGTVDEAGDRFWNATDACCDFYGSNVDDSGYLRALMDEIKVQLNVDDRRVYFVGHSNGGFMSYRMACDHSQEIAAIASLAGATFADPADCSPGSPVHVLQIHGTEDEVLPYEGGWLMGIPYPGAVETVEQWAEFGGCSLVGVPTPPNLDLDASVPGDETTVYRYATDCEPDGSAELWLMKGSGHVPVLSDQFSRLIIEYLFAHAKSEPASVAGSGIGSTPAAGGVFFPAIPNPFNPETRLRYRLAEASRVVLTVHDVAGRTMRRLLAGEEQAAGYYELTWNGSGDDGDPLSPGIYFVSLATDHGSTIQKVVLAK